VITPKGAKSCEGEEGAGSFMGQESNKVNEDRKAIQTKKFIYFRVPCFRGRSVS